MAITSEVHKIIEALYRDKRVNEYLSKLKPATLQDDLFMHCISEVYRIAEKYDGKIEALADRDQMFAWFHGLVKMQLFSERSTFYRKHRRTYIDLDQLDRDTPDDAPPGQYQTQQREIYEALIERGGKKFADAQLAELDRQEEERVNRFEAEDKAKAETKQLELWFNDYLNGKYD